LSKLQDSYLQTVTFGGGIYGIPGRTSMAGGWLYNRAVYDELGLSVPTTWAELMANCEAIQAAGKTAVIGSYKDSWTSQLLLLADFHNLQVQVPGFAADYDANTAKFATTPEALRAFEKLAEVYERGFLNKDFLATTFDLAVEMLVNGDGVHYPMLTFALSGINTNFGAEAAQNIGIFAQPADDAEHTGLTVWMPDGWYACNTSPNADAVVEFFDFILSEEGQNILITHSVMEGPSVVAGVELPDDVLPAIKDMLQYFDSGKTAPALEFITVVKGPNTPQICVEVGTGVVTPAEGAAALDADVELTARQMGLPGW
jgi:raffinose/stachyose/melibiose transport system substrate-binding protein